MKLLGARMALREKRRHATTVLGVATAVVLTVFLVGVYRGAVRGSLDYVAGVEADVWVGRRGTWNLMRAGGLLDADAATRVAAVPGVAEVTPIVATLLPAEGDDAPRTLLVVGIDRTASAPPALQTGTRLPGPGEIVIDRAFAARHGYALADSLQLAGRRLKVAGVSRGTNLLVTQYAFVSLDQLRHALGVPGRATFLLCRAEPGQDPASLAHRIETALPGSAAFPRETFLGNNRREIEQGFLPVLGAMATLGALASVAIVTLAMIGSVRERRLDFAILTALGFRRFECARVVGEQALGAALAGGLLGLLVLAVLERLLPFVVPEVEFHLDPRLAAAALGGAVVTGILGALAASREAGSVPPMEVFRG